MYHLKKDWCQKFNMIKKAQCNIVVLILQVIDTINTNIAINMYQSDTEFEI